MRRKTTTKKLQQAIKDKLLHITKAEKYSKSTRKTTTISIDTFKDDLDFICETIFADVVGWHYEYGIKSKQYIIDCGRMNGDSDFIFIAHLCVNDGVKVESVDKALRVIEEECLLSNTDKKNFIVYNQRMAGYLMQKGFVLIDMKPDLKNTRRNVFFFNDTPQLKSAIDEYMSR